MRQYETIYIINPEFEEDAIKELVDKFKALIEEQGGQVSDIDEGESVDWPIPSMIIGRLLFLMNLCRSTQTWKISRLQQTHETHY